MGILHAAIGCSDEPPVPASAERTTGLATPEPIVVRAGGRDVRVRCALSCDDARAELARLRDDCVADPTSTPHHVVARGPLVALGCCTESEHVYARACGVETIAGCAARWLAECDSGRLPP
ncbi:MAG: hypothetical protein M3Y87_22240 [Myxococcota bacterium]|nr:hypothetical protein [Myxococcota bacterium]